jgi:hypothetical protein
MRDQPLAAAFLCRVVFWFLSTPKRPNMKSLLLAGTAFAVASGIVHAQSLTITAPGYSSTKLFDSTAGFTITGMAATTNGDVYYIETDSVFNGANSRLLRRSAGDGYAGATPIFDFGAFVFGSFVETGGGLIIFGESSTGAIRAVNPDLTIDALGSVPGNFDLAIFGSSLFLSHNPGFTPANRVSQYTLVSDGLGGSQLSAAELLLTTNDYSGPVETDAAGNLYYGGPNVVGAPDLFRFTAAEVAAAAGAGPDLALDPAHRFLANGTNAYLALDDSGALWQSNFGALNRIDTTVPSSTVIGTTLDSIGYLDFAGSLLFASVTNSSFDRSAVYTVVPEPSCGALLGLGLGALAGRRRRKD